MNQPPRHISEKIRFTLPHAVIKLALFQRQGKIYMLTLEQQIAQKQDELARLKEKAQKQENAQKIVIGGMVLAVARKNPQYAQNLLNLINQEVNRDTDKKRLEGVISELREVINQKQADSSPTVLPQTSNQV